MSLYLKILKKIPFSQLWIHKKAIGDNMESLLDVGCGNGSFMKDLSSGEKWNITGIDIFPKEIEIAKKTKTYKKLIRSDVLRGLIKLLNMGMRYDVVFSSQLVEHLSEKDVIAVINLMEKIAKKRVVITTTNGFMEQPSEFNYKNPYQHHKSGFDAKEFRKKGYKVYGLGVKFIWKDGGLARNGNRIVKDLFIFLSILLSPLVAVFPQFGAGIIASKKI